METVSLASLCSGLHVPRSRIDRWISDGAFKPIDDKPGLGKARGWTKQDAIRLACLLRLVNAGLPVEVGKAISRLHGFAAEPAFLVVLAHDRTLWRSETQPDGTTKAIDTGERYQAFVVRKDEIVEQLGQGSWLASVHILLNLDDIEDLVGRAWSIAERLDK